MIDETKLLSFIEPFNISGTDSYPIAESLKQGVLFSPINAKRVLVSGDRFYYYTTEGESGIEVSKFFPSVTTITKHGKHTDINLLKWYSGQNWSDVLEGLFHARRYGTFLHIVQAELSARMMVEGDNTIDLALGDLRTAYVNYAKRSGLPWSWVVKNWLRLCKDLMSWRWFCKIYDVEFMLIEKTLFNNALGYAGTVDYVMRLTDGARYRANAKGGKKGELKGTSDNQRLVAEVDVKSGRSGMHPEGALQLKMNALALEENFGLEVDYMLHYNPTDWRSWPGFNLQHAGAHYDFHKKTDKPAHEELVNLEQIISIAHNRIGEIDGQNYKKTVSGWLMEGNGFEFNTLSVREAVELNESGRAVELGMAENDEQIADFELSEFLKSAFVVKGNFNEPVH